MGMAPVATLEVAEEQEVRQVSAADPTSLKVLNDLLDRLDRAHGHYLVTKVRPEAIMVEVWVPGEHWEIEFMEDGELVIERYRSSGHISDKSALDELWPLLE
jgi:hypothetical protein